MKKITLIAFALCFISKTNAQNIYDDALSAATYAYSHSKKAHGANNVFHTQEYAEKAIESFLKVEELATQCECEEANEIAFKARTDMESSLEQDTFERSRYFAKRAKDYGTQLFDEISSCQTNKGSYSNTAITSQNMDDKKQELNEKRMLLELEQQKLEQQIAQQNKIEAEFKAKRNNELKKQAIIKTKAELALQKLENALQELSIALNEKSNFEAQSDYVRSDKELKNESLVDTKSFYINRAKELTNTANQQFANFGNDIDN